MVMLFRRRKPKTTVPSRTEPNVLRIVKDLGLTRKKLKALELAMPFDRVKGIIPGRSFMIDVILRKKSRLRKAYPNKKYLYKSHTDPDVEPSRETVSRMQIEVGASNLFRLLDPDHIGRAYTVINHKGIADGCLLERIENLKTIDELNSTQDLDYTPEMLLNSGITPILVYNYLLKNADFRTGNMGMANGKFMAFDLDSALWDDMTQALVNQGKILTDSSAEQTFCYSIKDLQQFPILSDSKPTHWAPNDTGPFNQDNMLDVRTEKFINALRELPNNQRFIEEKYFCFFKFSLLFYCRTLLEKNLSSSINANANEFTILVEGLKNQAKQISFLLKSDEQFKPFYRNLNDWHQTIKTQISDAYPEAKNELDNAFIGFYKDLTPKSTATLEQGHEKRKEDDSESYEKAANNISKQWKENEPRRTLVRKNSIRNINSRVAINTVSHSLDRLLTNKTAPEAEAELFEHCKQLQLACQNFKTEQIALLLVNTPKHRTGFFSRFVGLFKDSHLTRKATDLFHSKAYKRLKQDFPLPTKSN